MLLRRPSSPGAGPLPLPRAAVLNSTPATTPPPVWLRCLAAAGILAAAACGGSLAPPPAGSETSAKGEPALVAAGIERILEDVRRPGASAVLVNVWATWCLPCREEFPDLMKLHRNWKERGLRLVLVSGDFEGDRAAAIRFLSEHGVDFPSFLKEGSDMEFIDGLDPGWSGALPATFLYDSSGRLRRFWEGKADYATLERRLEDVVSGRSGSPAEIEEKK